MSNAEKKALVIGAAGFVGPYLVQAIHDDLHADVIATKLGHETLVFEESGNYTTTVENLDIMNQEEIESILKKYQPDYVFHLAAQSSVAYSWKNPGLTVDINIKGALNVLDAIRTMEKQPKVLIIGSGEEYGHIRPEAVPVSEEEVLHPGNIYAATKACQNMIGSIYTKAYGMNLVMTRSFNHMGPAQRPTFVVADFCRQAARIEQGLLDPVIHVGNLEAKRDFTDVRDVVHGYTALIEQGKPGETYNVGTGHAYKIRDILDKIIAQSTAEITVEVEQARLRPVDVPIIEPDMTKTFAVSDWRPQISLETTIGDMLAYWRTHED